MIKLVDVEKTYFSKAGDIAALKKTNIEVKEGEIFGIIGLSGAGKSTLIRCAYGRAGVCGRTGADCHE